MHSPIWNKKAAAFFTSKQLQETNLVKHCFTSRIGGVSPVPFNTLNMGTRRADKRENILENYRRVCRAIDVDHNALIIANYVHGTNVVEVVQKDAGKGIHREELDECDGLVTNEVNLPIVTLHADCIPIFYMDPIRRAIGVCHSGWRGVYGKASVSMLKKMKSCFGTGPSECLISLGPSIQACCFEVDKPEADMFRADYPAFVFEKGEGKYNVDLPACVNKQLLQAGAKQENISISRRCTSCDTAHLFSARAEEQTGAMAAIIALKP